MPAPPRDQLHHVIVGDLGQQLALAEKLDQLPDLPPRIVGTGMVLPDFAPISAGHIIEPHRRACGLNLRDVLLGALALGALYRFRIPLGRGLG